MRKFISIILILCCSLFVTPHIFAQSYEQPNISVTIQSPDSVREYPGFETKIKAKVINNTDQSIPNVMAYITMANTVKHWTVNLEDYSADQPITIGTLKPHEKKRSNYPSDLSIRISISCMSQQAVIKKVPYTLVIQSL